MAKNLAVKVAPLRRPEDELEPIVLSEIPLEGGYLRFRNPLVLAPTWDDSGEFLRVAYPDLRMLLFGESRKVLTRLVIEDIRGLWLRIACEEDSRLSRSAQVIKCALKTLVEEAESAQTKAKS